MRACQNCGEKSPCTIRIEGKKRNLGNRKFCLVCSPFKYHNTKSYVGKKTEEVSLCRECNREYVYRREAGHGKTICNSCKITLRKNRLKELAVKYKGGKCCVCGYSRCMRALQFHHLDRKKKEFGIGANNTHHLSWEKVKREVDKCVLVCAVCHAEIEEGMIDLKDKGI